MWRWEAVRLLLRAGLLFILLWMLLVQWRGRFWLSLVLAHRARLHFLAQYRRRARASLRAFAVQLVAMGSAAPPIREGEKNLQPLMPVPARSRR